MKTEWNTEDTNTQPQFQFDWKMKAEVIESYFILRTMLVSGDGDP
jgi:hypothetical protein